MIYKFAEFDFNSESLVLMKNSEAIAIRHNEAKVLAFLLENVDSVLSKENILSHVWQGKVVSEQAVFQNISHLRILFGSHAIKTFSKRGYQWHLNVEVHTESPLSEPLLTEEFPPKKQIEKIEQVGQVENASHQVKTAKVETAKLDTWPYFLLVSLIVIIVGFMNWPNSHAEEDITPSINLAYIPIVDPQTLTSLNMQDNDIFDFTELANINAATFITSADLEYPNLAKQYPFVFTGKIRNYQEKVYLDFLLKGPYADWQGQISANTNEDLKLKLLQHLNQPFIYQLLRIAQAPDFKKSSLTIAHQQQPQDSIILCQLINIYVETNELDKAMALAEKLATNARVQRDLLQLGNALLYQSTILTRKELYQLSDEKLKLAIKSFENINDLARNADAWHAKSWIEHQNDDYPAIKKSLLMSAKLALEVGDKPREIDALTYLSILAHKHKQEEDKYNYLLQAENKMKAYQLPIYHFAKVPFHYAIFAKNFQDEEPHLKQVLAFTKLTPDHWVAQSSRQKLVLQYISENRLQEAQVLVDGVSTDNAQNSYLKTLLSKENQQVDVFIANAQRTFELAQLSGQQTLSLDVALLLCSTPNIDVNYDFYSLYIDENASKHWRRANEVRLLALNI